MIQWYALSLCMILSVLWPPDGIAAASPASAEATASAKRRIERERRFLYRSVEDLGRAHEFSQAALGELDRQIAAVDVLEPASREKDLGSLHGWYQSYGDWISGVLAELETDLSQSYSDNPAETVRPERYSALLDGNARQRSRLSDIIAALEKMKDRTSLRMADLRLAIEYVSSAAYALDLKKYQGRRGKNRENDGNAHDLYERYKDITDAELSAMQRELSVLGDLDRHYGLLIELGGLELFWLSGRSGDWEALGRLARVIGGEATAPISEAGVRVIQTYETGIVSFKRKVDDISRARSRIVPSGSLRTLDRVEELTDVYDLMKQRYERHIVWLTQQAGAYRADLTELKSGK